MDELLVGTFAEEIVRVLKFIILLVVKLDSAYQFDKFKFFNRNKQNWLVFCLLNNCCAVVKF